MSKAPVRAVLDAFKALLLVNAADGPTDLELVTPASDWRKWTGDIFGIVNGQRVRLAAFTITTELVVMRAFYTLEIDAGGEKPNTGPATLDGAKLKPRFPEQFALALERCKALLAAEVGRPRP
jgi:hypothetical protein